MEDYFTAHKKRLEKINKDFLELANELTKKGCIVFHSKNGFITFLCIIYEDKQVTVGFTEVPYHYYFSTSWNPSKENGSGRCLYQRHDLENLISSEEVFKYLLPIDIDKNKFIKNKESYLQEYFLKE